MASRTLTGLADPYGVGTTVGAYPASGWLQSQLPPSGAPQGSATATGTIGADGSITLTGLADGTAYYLTETSGTPRHYTSFQTPAGPGSETVSGTVAVSGDVSTTVADGGNATIGAKADAASVSGGGSVIAFLRRLRDFFKAEDSASASGDYGLPLLVVRNDADAVLTDADGDYTMLAVDSSGRIKLVSSGTPGSAVPSRALQIGGSDGTNLRALKVEADGALSPRLTTAATLANVASSASSVTLLASNTAARARKIFNDSTAVLYLKFGTTASTTSYTVQVAPGGYYEFPNPLYTGRVDGIWASANGNARTTEET